jgi:benzoylformate decarboxylase
MVVTVGQQDRRHLIQDPMLGGDLLALAQGAFKDAVEVNQVEDLPTLIRRAFLLSQTAPTGPVMVSIPVDILEEELDEPLPERTEVRGLGVAEGADEAEALLGGRPAIVAGDGVGRAGAVDLVALAEAWAPRSSMSPCTTASTSRRRILYRPGCSLPSTR